MSQSNNRVPPTTGGASVVEIRLQEACLRTKKVSWCAGMGCRAVWVVKTVSHLPTVWTSLPLQ